MASGWGGLPLMSAGGSILFEGTELTTLGREAMRALRGPRIATVFQDPMGALNPVLSVEAQMVNIQYRSGLSKPEKRARAVEMLELVRIPDAAAAVMLGDDSRVRRRTSRPRSAPWS